MRKLNNVQMDGESYFDVFRSLLQGIPGQATGYEVMRRAVPLMEKLEKVPSAVDSGPDAPFPDMCTALVEDSEWELLKGLLMNPNAFGRNDRGILDMIEHVLEAPAVDVKEDK